LISAPSAASATPDYSTPILVLRRTFGELQHGVLGLARSVGRLGVPVYAVGDSPREIATRSRYLRGTVQAPQSASAEEWLETLVTFGLARGRPVLLSIDDGSAAFADEQHAALSDAFRMAKDPAGMHRRLASKRGLWDLCRQFGLATPSSSFPTSEDEVVALADRYGYPVVLKLSEHWRPPADPHAPSVLIARSPVEVLRGYRRMESRERPNVIVQEHIPGGADAVWMFNGYFDRDSECVCAFTGQKLRQRGRRTGPTTLGVCTWNQAVADLATRLMSCLGYQGIVDMGVRYDERDDQYKVLDVNPRIGSSFRLFVGEDGLDVVRAAYLDLTGQPVPRTRLRDGRKWVVEPYDLVASTQELRNGTLSVSRWARSFSGVQEAAWWAHDDPLPFYGMCASLGWQAVRYAARRRQIARAGRQAGSGRSVGTDVSAQGEVDRFFDQSTEYWRDVYRRDGLQGLIYRERMEAALYWVEQLDLPRDSAALDVGCGAGLMAAELGRRGLHVTATDSSAEMVKTARRQARTVGLTDAVRVDLADAHRLPFTGGQFDLVISLGLLPWLHDPRRALQEMVRVLRPGGWIVVTADNRARLNLIVEPRENPVLAPIKVARRAAKRIAGQVPNSTPSRLHRPDQIDLMLRAAGAEPRRRTTVGFGPFTFLGRPLVGDATGLRLHGWLERASADRAPALRRLGWHYLVAAQKQHT
jgi:predicted ATP-grasp superfamily ATP-dependent carboligase/ubiquinone/menaquinone biosynthesis C-methylase UbiE